MKISARNNRLSVVVTPFEYMRIFDDHDGEYVDIITDDNKMDVLFPKWREYTDKDDVLGTIRRMMSIDSRKWRLSVTIPLRTQQRNISSPLMTSSSSSIPIM